MLARDRGELEDLRDDQIRRRLGVLRESVDLRLHQAGHALPVLIIPEQLAQLARGLAAWLLVCDELGQHFDQPGAIRELIAIQRRAATQHLGALVGILDHRAAVPERPIELGPLRRTLQRLLQRIARALGVRIHADGAAQVVDARLIVALLQLAAELDEQLARLAARLSFAEPGARVDLGELLGDLERLRIELRCLLEVHCRAFEVLVAKRELAELEPDDRLATRGGRRVAEDFELRGEQLADHPLVAERRVELARGIERLGALRLELPRLLVVPQRAIDATEALVPQLRCAAVMLRAARRDLGLRLGARSARLLR